MTITEYMQKISGDSGIRRQTGTWFRSPLRNDQHASFEVNDDLGKFHDWGNGDSGSIYDLVMMVEHCDFVTAKKIVGEEYLMTKKIVYEKKIEQIEVTTNKEFYHTSLIEYARRRCVDFYTLRKYCYEVIKDRYYYIGLRNDSGGYAVRNEYFKGQIGSNDITTIEGNDVALVFEGMFDFLSFRSAVASPNDVTYIVLNTTQNIKRIDTTKYQEIHLYLDNDKAGDIATKSIVDAIDHRPNYANYDDVNDYIINLSSFR